MYRAGQNQNTYNGRELRGINRLDGVAIEAGGYNLHCVLDPAVRRSVRPVASAFKRCRLVPVFVALGPENTVVHQHPDIRHHPSRCKFSTIRKTSCAEVAAVTLAASEPSSTSKASPHPDHPRRPELRNHQAVHCPYLPSAPRSDDGAIPPGAHFEAAVTMKTRIRRAVAQ
jgi:hypothetical protein